MSSDATSAPPTELKEVPAQSPISIEPTRPLKESSAATSAPPAAAVEATLPVVASSPTGVGGMTQDGSPQSHRDGVLPVPLAAHDGASHS